MSTAAERTVDNPTLSAAFQAKAQHDIRDAREFSTTADKILGLLKDEPITVQLTDDVSLQFYPPSDDEYLEIISFQADGMQVAARAKTIGVSPDNESEAVERIPEALEIVKDARVMLDKLNSVLARLSVDHSFTEEAFRQMPRRYKTQILQEISASYAGEMQKVKKFRRK